MNILDNKIEDIRLTKNGDVIQGSGHTCYVLNHKVRNKIIIKSVCDLRKISDSFDSIACCGVSGLLVVAQVAELLDKHIIVIRKTGEKCYSEFRTEGVAPFRYVVLDDLICSGSTINRITSVIKSEYPRARPVGVYCYLPKETIYPPDKTGSKYCEQELGMPLLNIGS